MLERVVDDIIFNNRNTIFNNNKPENIGVIYTRVDVSNKPKQQNYMDALKDTDIVTDKEINIFQNTFIESHKLSTSEFKKMLTDRSDLKLDNMIGNICDEFIERIGDINHESTDEKNQIN